MPTRVTCPLCCRSNVAEEYCQKDGYTLWRCRVCTFVYVHPIPHQSLPDIYGQGYFKREEDAIGFGYADYDHDKEPMRDTFKQYLKRFEELVSGRHIFDVGTATGYFLDIASADGWKTSGIDISAYAAGEARSRGHDVVSGRLPEESIEQPVDVVTMWDVLEHVDDPRLYLTKVHSMLKEDGVLAINTVDIGSLWARVMGSRWHLLVPPEHLYYYSSATVTRWLQECGFEVIEIRKLGKRFSLPYIFGTLYRWQGLFFWKWLSKQTDRPFFRSLKIPINLRDNMFVLVRKRGDFSR